VLGTVQRADDGDGLLVRCRQDVDARIGLFQLLAAAFTQATSDPIRLLAEAMTLAWRWSGQALKTCAGIAATAPPCAQIVMLVPWRQASGE
jgi:hypothetical protein